MADLPALHRRLVSGCRDALDGIAEALLESLQQRIRHRRPDVPRDAVNAAVVDALIGYGASPDRFDLQSGCSLETYLYVAAYRNVSDWRRSESRRREREIAYSRLSRPPCGPCPPPALHGMTLSAVLAASPPEEREGVRLWWEGERRTEVYGAALQLMHRPAEERRAEVKRFKDRVIKRCIRLSRRTRRRDTKGAAEVEV